MLPGQQNGRESRKMQEILQNTSKCKKSCIMTRPRSRSPPAPCRALRGPPTAPAPSGGMRSGYAVIAALRPGKAPKTGENTPRPD